MKKKKRNWASLLLALLGIGMIAFAIIYYVPSMLDMEDGTQDYDDLRNQVVITTTVPDDTEPDETFPDETKHGIPIAQKNAEELSLIYPCIDVDHAALLAQNSNYIGWLYIPGTNVSYPVCQTDNNQYYLKHNFDGSYGYPGTIFLDRRNWTVFDAHTVVFGHNLNNGTMFNQVAKFRNEDFAKEHPVFWFITKDGQKLLYEVFSVATVQKDDENVYRNFFDPNNPEPERFQARIEYLLEKSSFDMGVTPTNTSSIMTLSTCKGGTTRYTVNGALLWVFEPAVEPAVDETEVTIAPTE